LRSTIFTIKVQFRFQSKKYLLNKNQLNKIDLKVDFRNKLLQNSTLKKLIESFQIEKSKHVYFCRLRLMQTLGNITNVFKSFKFNINIILGFPLRIPIKESVKSAIHLNLAHFTLVHIYVIKLITYLEKVLLHKLKPIHITKLYYNLTFI